MIKKLRNQPYAPKWEQEEINNKSEIIITNDAMIVNIKFPFRRCVTLKNFEIMYEVARCHSRLGKFHCHFLNITNGRKLKYGKLEWHLVA
jgi:hypothetical protein